MINSKKGKCEDKVYARIFFSKLSLIFDLGLKFYKTSRRGGKSERGLGDLRVENVRFCEHLSKPF